MGAGASWHLTTIELTKAEWARFLLPEFQGRGLARAAVQLVISRARADGRWGNVHAFPSIENDASNAICRSCGFALLGIEDTEFAGHTFRTNHWMLST